MYTFIIILILIACALMIFTVLAQNPKSGMAANFGASNAVMGVRQTADLLEKTTWTLAIVIVVLSLAATMSIPKGRIDTSNTNLGRGLQQSIEEGTQSFETLPLLPLEEVQPAEGEPVQEQPVEQPAE